ncbi:MAG: 4Fe-4S binding protein [Planctomycetes bacterium]|nr:4Fe-4S binding protein [Planctomycetota bacterium]
MSHANLFFPFLKANERRGWRGRLHKLFSRIGATTRASPVRRAVQVACLMTFLMLFFYAAWPYGPVFDNDLFYKKEFLPAEVFLWLDPLLGFSTALAARTWNVALWWALGILTLCLFFPRGFCGYFCPLGTAIDFFDWAVGRHVKRFKLKVTGGWVHTKYYLLAAILIAAAGGVLLSGYLAAIPVITRGLLFVGAPIQLGLLKNWGMVPPIGWTYVLSIVLFAAVFALGFLEKRFWCRYVCPTGAVFSVFNLFRVGERKVESSCIKCNKCVEICPFDAIKADFTTRTADCTFCQSCGGVCPTHSIQFTTRWNLTDLKAENDPPVHEHPTSRRGFLAASAAGLAGAAAVRVGWLDAFRSKKALLRPPGSVSEESFNDLCIRCGECFKVCPGPVLQPAGLEGGIEALWTPVVVPSHAGCHQECNYCTQVCPTGAIQPLALEEKRVFRLGLAIVNTKTCLPHAGERDCQLCYDECKAAGYDAIQMRQISLPVPENLESEGLYSALEIEQMSTILAPFVIPEKCVGCGLCEYRCNTALVKLEPLLQESAIVVVAENESRAAGPVARG